MLKSFGPLTLALSLLTISTGVWAQAGDTVQSPVFKVGDSWKFGDVIENGTTGYSETQFDMVVERLDDTTMIVGIKHDGASAALEDHIVGADWSLSRLIDGRQTVTAEPLEFPMGVGRKWTVDYVDPTRRGNQSSFHVHRTYSVVGWSDVDVPAGHFHAMKIIADGVDEAMIATPASAGSSVVASPGGTASMSHAQRAGIGKLVRTTHGEFYYVPAIRYWVKSIEEQYNTDNIRVSSQTRSLISFTPAN